MKRTIRFTREGKRFLIAVILITLAALNTGNNLIYLIFALMLSLLLVSVLGALVNLGSLRCDLVIREPLYAGVPFGLEAALFNGKRMPSYSVSVEIPGGAMHPLYVPVVRRGMNRIRFEGVAIEQRGKYVFRDLALRTGFPFIFLTCRLAVPWEREFFVYPALIGVKHLVQGLLPSRTRREIMRRGHEGDFLYLREYVAGEGSRHIDWKATARTQKTMVKEFSETDRALASVILDGGGNCRKEAFEKAVSLAASLCAEFAERGYFVRLITCRKVIPYGRGKAHHFKMLDILAQVRPDAGEKCPVSEPVEGHSVLVVCSDRPGFAHLMRQCSRVVDARELPEIR